MGSPASASAEKLLDPALALLESPGTLPFGHDKLLIWMGNIIFGARVEFGQTPKIRQTLKIFPTRTFKECSLTPYH